MTLSDLIEPRFCLTWIDFPVDPHAPKRRVYPGNPFPVDPNAPISNWDKLLEAMTKMQEYRDDWDYYLIVPAHLYKEYHDFLNKPKKV